MTALLLDGTATAKTIRAETAVRVKQFTAATGVVPTLAAILAGDDPASQTYVQMKARACARAGIGSQTFPFPNDAPQSAVQDCLDRLNADAGVHGILIQHPLPKHMDEPFILSQLRPEKDVDGISPLSLGRLAAGLDAFHACTPAGMVELMKRYGLLMAGRHAVVVGRSVILGKPLALLLLAENATVTVCHSRTPDLGSITRQADILCACVGRAGLITGEMVKPGAVVLDAGYQDNRGDVDFAGAKEVASAITPVPGGVGPMTIAMLLQNTAEAAATAARSPHPRPQEPNPRHQNGDPFPVKEGVREDNLPSPPAPPSLSGKGAGGLGSDTGKGAGGLGSEEAGGPRDGASHAP